MKASEWAIRNRNIVSALFTGAGAYHIFTQENRAHVECGMTEVCLDMDEKQGEFDCFSY